MARDYVIVHYVAAYPPKGVIMAEWPANADTDWNTKMKANIDVGHDSDGTHKKSQMLTDMEWSPTAMTGGFTELTTSTASFSKTITYPNGLIHLLGYDNNPSDFTIDISGASFTAVYYANAFGYDDNQTSADRHLFVNVLTPTSIALGAVPAATSFDGIFYEVWGR